MPPIRHSPSNVQKYSVGQFIPRIVFKDTGRLSYRSAITYIVQPWEPAPVRKIREHIQIRFKVGLYRRSYSILATRRWNPSCHVVELVAIEIYPVPPLCPVARVRRGQRT